MLDPGLGGLLAKIRATAIVAMFLMAAVLGAPGSAMGGGFCEDDLVSCHSNVNECLDEAGGLDECLAFGQEECPGELVCTAGQPYGCHPNNPYAVVCSVEET